MVLCKDKDNNCKKGACFNFEGEIKGLYCFKHKLKDMIDVKNKKCIHPDNCKKQAIFNFETETKGLYCTKHKLENMIDVINKKCIHIGCKIIPNFNFEEETKGKYCVKHKLDNMIDVKNKMCTHTGCKINPVYNFEGKTKRLYCFEHKLDNMINIVTQICIYEGCKTRANYNVEGKKQGLFCVKHKLDNMIDVKSKTCIYTGCKTRANYNIEGKKQGLFCVKHKLDDMIDVIHKTCNSDWCYTIVQNKYDRYCLYCYMNLFPDKPVTRNYKTKEYSVVEYVKNTFPDLNWIADKIINGGCSKRRPDLILDLLYQIIIIEVDENQHIDYDCSCENKRIMELSQDLGHRPIIFIRFNPDDYNKNDKVVTSCWGIDKNGICAVKKSKKTEWTQRLTTLEKQISYWINPTNITNKTVEIIQLFYDE